MTTTCPPARYPLRRATTWIAVVALACATVVGVGVSGARADDRLCETFALSAVDGGRYNVQNNNYGNHGRQCVTATSAGFDVDVADGSIPPGGAPKSYPSILAGCHWGRCTTGSALPIRASAIGAARTSVAITAAPGSWNAAYDIWFNSTPTTDVASDATEMMIWIDANDAPDPIGKVVGQVDLDGASWQVWQGKAATNVISFVREQGATSVDLALEPFVTHAIERGATKEGDYLTSVQFGFEPWSDGAGLAARGFSFTTTEQRQASATGDPQAKSQQDAPAPAKQAPAPGSGAGSSDAEQPPTDSEGTDAGERDQHPSPGGAGRGDHDGPGSAVTSGSGRCMDVAAAATADATIVQLYDCNTTSAQQWVATGSTLVNPASGKCLDVARAATAVGSRVQIWTCMAGASGQRWARGQGQSVTNPASRLCLATTGASTVNRSALVLATCDPTSPTQRWS